METYAGARFEGKIETFDPCVIQVMSQSQTTGSNQRLNESADSQQNQQVSQIHQEDQEQQSCQMTNMQPNTTLTPVKLPAILDGEFFSVVRLEGTNITVRCLSCDKLLNGNLKSTGNFLSHIKRVHPTMIDQIKSKSNKRRPAIAYIDSSAPKSSEVIVRTKRGYRKCYKTDDVYTGSEDTGEQPSNWPDSPIAIRRRIDDSPKIPSQSSPSGFEDEFDAIGKNVAAKLRAMRLDQRIIAEKLMSDVLFEAQLGTLTRESNLQIGFYKV